jgi:hypothetical protein
MKAPLFQRPAEYDAPPDNIERYIIQPKLDGVACAYHRGVMWSKSGKQFPAHRMAHFTDALQHVADDVILYGELWAPMPVATISGICNHYSNHQGPITNLSFVLYDYLDDEGYNVGYNERYNHLDWLYQPLSLYNSIALIDKIPTNDFTEFHDGTIYRLRGGIFVPGPRPTPNIRKVKKWRELDADVVGSTLGDKGSKLEGMVSSLHCRHAGVEFSVYSGLTFDHSTWYVDRLPKKVKIRYLKFGANGAPLNPTFVEELG